METFFTQTLSDDRNIRGDILPSSLLKTDAEEWQNIH
jgi:hypothetical protein